MERPAMVKILKTIVMVILIGLLASCAGSSKKRPAGVVHFPAISPNEYTISYPMDGEPLIGSGPDLTVLKEEIAGLRAEVELLRKTLDMFMQKLVTRFDADNRALRDEIRKLSLPGGVGEDQKRDPLYKIPPPYSNISGTPVLESDEAKQRSTDDEFNLSSRIQASKDLNYSIIAEWGRTPEQASELGENTSSLKGMVCVAESGGTDTDLMALGKKIRQEFDGYDNINIEVFDDETAARDYADSNIATPDHHVLRVSRHAKLGNDEIILVKDGRNTTVQWDE